MRSNRRGFSMVEALASMAVLSVVVVFAGQAIVAQQGWRRRAELRQLALIECENTLEQLAAMPWDDLTGERLAAIRTRDESRKLLAGAVLTASVDEQPGPPLAKRLRVEIAWPAATDLPARKDSPAANGSPTAAGSSAPTGSPTAATMISPVKLVTWVYRHER